VPQLAPGLLLSGNCPQIHVSMGLKSWARQGEWDRLGEHCSLRAEPEKNMGGSHGLKMPYCCCHAGGKARPRGCVEGEIGWGRREKGEDSPGTAMCRDVCFCAIWIWRGRREVMRWRGGYIEENVRGGCQICHQLCRDRVREAVASATNYARQCQTETESDEW
jgi:hypothetical protein